MINNIIFSKQIFKFGNKKNTNEGYFVCLYINLSYPNVIVFHIHYSTVNITNIICIVIRSVSAYKQSKPEPLYYVFVCFRFQFL